MKRKTRLFSVFGRTPWTFAAVAVCSVALAAADVGFKQFSGRLIDSLGETGALQWVTVAVIALLFLLLKFLHPYLCRSLTEKMKASFYLSLGESAVFGRQTELDKIDVGAASTNFTSDITGITMFADRICRRGITDVFLLFLSLFVLFRANVFLGLAAAVTSAVPLLAMLFVSKILVSENQRFQQVLSKINGSLASQMGSLEYLKANGLESFALEKNRGLLWGLVKAKRRMSLFEAVVGLPMLLCPFITVFTVSALGGYLVIKGELGIGQLFAAITLADNVVSPVMRFDNTVRRTRRAGACHIRLEKLLSVEREKSEPGILTVCGESGISLKAEGLVFAYPDRKAVFDRADFCFCSGGINILAGENGSGKSTFIKLLTGVLDPDGGSIVLEGCDVSKPEKRADLRKIIAVDPQTPVFFGGTIRDALNYDGNVSSAEMQRVCSELGLWKDISALPNGLDTVLEENGGFLSGGQKRRLSVACTVLRSCEVYVFDEPTAGVDGENGEMLCKMLEALAEKKLVIVITHDPLLLSRGTNTVTFEVRK